jgi:hypothetical protein
VTRPLPLCSRPSARNSAIGRGRRRSRCTDAHSDAADHALGEIDTLASNILSLVRTMRHAAQKDRAKMGVRLHDLLESYVAAVMSAAPH